MHQSIYNIEFIIIIKVVIKEGRKIMQKLVTLLISFIMVLPVFSIAALGDMHIRTTMERSSPGDILAVICSDPYPTLGEPVNLVVMMEGNAEARFNETINVTDEFQGIAAVNNDMVWDSGNVTVSQTVVTIGRLPTYTKSITWYPSVVGTHVFHIQAGSSEHDDNVSVSFDTEGIIAPSFGCPSIIRRSTLQDLSVTVAENRNSTEDPAHLLQATLQAIDGEAQYLLENQTMIWSAQLTTGVHTVQDELIAHYPIASVPDGFYNLTVTTARRTYTWPHAVKIMDSDPTNFTIVQLTDIHIGKYVDPVDKKKELTRLIAYANKNIHPDFLIISGDSVDWHNVKCHRNVFLDLREALLTSIAPVFIIPGNHERYGNPLVLLYYPFTNLTSYHRFLNPLNDYSFHYGGMNFVFLDSGYDYSRWEINRFWNTTPESTGLTNTQTYLLTTLWGDSELHQIITMHHPAVYDRNDSGPGAVPNNLSNGNDQCIAFNRATFINYCLTANVSLVLAGHTHESHVFTASGKEPSNNSAWPLFVQTRSSTLSGKQDGGRVVQIAHGVVERYDYAAFP
jgi:predicted MPP superfamily phosphohydrolase